MFREFLEQMQEEGHIHTVDKEVSKIYEIGRYLEDFDDDKIVEFPQVEGSKYPLLGNICPSRLVLAKSMGINKDELHAHLIKAIRNPVEPELVEDAPFLKNVDENVNLNNHPIPKFFKEDAGHYYTSGLIVVKALDTGVHNSSIHRQLIIADNETTARVVPRHLYHNIKVANEREEDLPIAVVFGLHPAVQLAASTPTDIELDEMHLANALLGGKLKRVKLPNGVLVPAHSEIVYEGVVVQGKRAKEGPFVDITGSLDSIRQEPVIRIDRVYYRDNAYHTTILPSKTEHFILMGLGKEVKIREYVGNVVPKVKDVYLSTGGAAWLHAIISIHKQTQGDGKNAIMAAFAAHGSLKFATIVDEDIDVYDPVNVEWAMVTRVGENDMVVIPKARGSSLDPARDEKEKVSVKIGIDATRDIYKDKNSYTMIKIPRDDE